MFIRFYNRCIMCDKVYYEPDKIGCMTPSAACPDCRKYYKRANQLKDRVKGDVDYKFIRRLLDNDECEYCGRKLSWREREIEHKTPVKRGGDNSNSNLCISCHACNVEKKDRTYEEYIAYRKTLKITVSDIKTMLDVFSKHILLETEKTIEEGVEYKESEVKHKLLKDDSGKTIGLRKIFIKNPEPMKVKRCITKTHLTEWGEAYNVFCKIVGRAQLQESVKSELLEEVPVIA